MEERRLDSESKAKLARGIIVAIIVLYWVCPDLFPGPIDDVIVTLLGVAVQKKIAAVE